MNIDKAIQELKEENARLRQELADLKETSLSEAHKAIEPYIAGGSEYMGTSGLIRAIKEIGESKRSSFESAKRAVIARKDAENSLNTLIQDINIISEYAENPYFRDVWEDIKTGEGTRLYNAIKDAASLSLHSTYLQGQVERLEEALRPFANATLHRSLNDSDYVSLNPVFVGDSADRNELHESLIPVHAFRKAAALTTLETTGLKPTVVCLCGSTRFTDAYQKANFDETLAGKVVLTIGCDMKSDAELFADKSSEELDQIKKKLDWLHKRKIDLADEVLVLNVDGYIGESTKSEIHYAQTLDKTIRYLEPIEEVASHA